MNDDGLTKYARYHLRKRAEAAGMTVEAYQEHRAAIEAQQAAQKAEAQAARARAEQHRAIMAERRRAEQARREKERALKAKERREREQARARAAWERAEAKCLAARRFDKATGRTLATDTGEVLGMYDRRCCGACGVPWDQHVERHEPPERPRNTWSLLTNPLPVNRAHDGHELERRETVSA